MLSGQLLDVIKGIESDQFVPYFQPIVELRSGVLTGFEILARWRHPERGIVTPDEFIPLTERSHSINALTEKLLQRAFVIAAYMPSHLTLSINISPTQLHDSSLPSQFQRAAASGRFPLERLIVEITESALASNLERARETAHALKDMGARLALDDFGTGFSSLIHLQKLPFDELKVDASFVRSITKDRDSRKIAAAIIGLGHSLGLTTVAEGIEDQAQADLLLWLGCELGQGWFYGQPIAPRAMTRFDFAHPPGPPAGMPVTGWDHEASTHLEALPAQRLAQLQAIYDGAHVGLCFLDRNLRYTSINRGLAEIDGLPVAYHLGRAIADVVPEMYSHLETCLQRALRGKPTASTEIHDIDLTQSGDPRSLLVSCQPARDEAGEVIGISVSVIDITDRAKAEKALKESEDHYRNTVELSPQVTWTADPNGRILDFGSLWETLTGMTRDETLGEGWINALHPDDVEPARLQWEQSRRTGAPIDIEYRIGRKHGNYRWMRARAYPRRGENGEVTRWYGVVEDIDMQKKTERALLRSQSRLQAVFDAVPVGLVIAEAPSGRIVMRNPHAEYILGPSDAEIDTIDAYRKRTAFHPDGTPVQPHEYPLARAILHGETTPPEQILYQRADGSKVLLRATASPVRGLNGEITGGVLALEEIDGEKEPS
ncbi:EAL domain-containing protein [Edaphobacter bradus]|uniref:EAL domain-containing protein n=1 Tax=Edaphobacter bradus TaxID=2259016 RepID=UPI0021DFCBF8|nr:EAL domain-containing protein [Edaphobacter bradus]